MTTPAPSVRSGLPPTPSRPTCVRWQIVALLVSFSFMTWFNRVSMSVAYDEQIKAQADITPEAMGYIYSAFLFAYMLCMTPGGWLIDRHGPWAALVLMGLGSAFFGALTAVAGLPVLVAAGLLWPALLVIRTLMGVLTAPIYPACSRVVSHWMPVAQRTWANGLVQAGAAVGIACAFPVFGALIDQLGWQGGFVVSGTFTALLALAWAAYGSNYPSEHRRVNEAEQRWIGAAPVESTLSAAAPAWQVLGHNRSLALLTVSYAAVGYIEYLFFFWMHYYFEDVLHLGKEESRLYAAVLNLALAAGMVLGGWAADRLQRQVGQHRGRAWVALVGMSASGILLFLGLLTDKTGLMVACLALALAAVGAAEAPVWTTAVELGGAHGGLAAAICNTGGNAGGLLAPVLTPWLSGWISRQFGVSEQLGWQGGIGVGSLLAILGASLWLWITPPAGQDRQAAQA